MCHLFNWDISSWLALWFAVSGTGAGWLGASTLQQGKMQDN